MIEPAFRLLLTEAAPVSAVVGDRVYHNVVPQNERRARLVLLLASKEHGHTFQGEDTHVNGNMLVTCLAPTYQQAKELAAAVRTGLDGFGGTKDGTEFGYIECVDESDVPAEPLQGEATPTFGVSLDFSFLGLSGF